MWRNARPGCSEQKGSRGARRGRGFPFREFAFRWEADFPWGGLVVPGVASSAWWREAVESSARQREAGGGSQT